MGSFGALVCVRIQPQMCLSRCFTLCSPAFLLAAAISAISPASWREENSFHPKQQVIHISARLLACLPNIPPGVWIQQDQGSAQPPPSQVNPWFATSSREHKKCCNSLRAIRGEDAKECAQHCIALCWGRRGVYKKSQLGWEPFACNRTGWGLGISKNIIDFLFATKQKNTIPLELCFHSYADINIQIPRLFLMCFFSDQNRLFQESKHPWEGSLLKECL